MVSKAKRLTIADYKTNVHNDWCPGCVLPDTIIHTNPSIKQINQLKEGDKVLGLDGKFHKVREVISHIHKGKMIRLVTKCFGTTVLTPEHPVLIVRREDEKLHNNRFNATWVRADEINVKDYLVYPILKEEKDLEYIDLNYDISKYDRVSKEMPARIRLDNSILRLFGYYIAEGYAHKRTLNFTFGIGEDRYVDDVTITMKRVFDLEPKIRVKDNSITLTFNSAILARLFVSWFGDKAYNKRIPNFLMLLSREKQIELLKGLWLGDGWIDIDDKRASLKTTSKVLCEQVKLLLIKQGMIPIITVNKAYANHRESYSIQIANDRDFAILCKILDIDISIKHEGKPPSSLLMPDYILIPVKDIQVFDYDGFVYNLEVDDVNSYISENAILHNCGDFGILNAIQMTLAEMQLANHKVAIFSGIGCSGKTPHFINTYGIHTLHGRVLPYAIGAKLANPNLEVIAVGGDGDGLGIGAGHFVNAGRRNVDLAYVIFDNGVYGLTKGQASPTLKLGVKTKSLPNPNINQNVNPIALAIVSGFTFVARGYSYDIKHLKSLIKQAIEHKGLALVDVLQPCPTYNDVYTKAWFAGEGNIDPKTNKQIPRVYKLEDEGYDPVVHEDDEEEVNAKVAQAFAKSTEWGNRIPIGVFYKNDHIPTYEQRIEGLIRNYMSNPPALQRIDKDGFSISNISKLIDMFRVTSV